jgi:hypothetical protein
MIRLPTRAEWILGLASTLLCAAIALPIARSWTRARVGVEEVDRRVEMRDLLAGRAAPESDARSAAAYPPPLLREPMSEAEARVFFPAIDQTKQFQFDPIVYFRRLPGLDQQRPLPHLNRGRYRYRTNSLGYRGPDEPLAAKPALRVLVTGDSHVEGVARDDEVLTHQLGERLRSAHPESSSEVLNLALGFYGPYHYLGVIEKYAPLLSPDVFVVIVYGGNDFRDAVALQRFYARRPPHRNQPWSARRYADRVRAIPRNADPGTPRGAGAQAFEEVRYFLNNPEDEPVAVDTLASVSEEIARVCRVRGIRLLFVYLPPAPSIQWTRYADQLDEARELFGFERSDLELIDRVADAWLAFLRDRGYARVDLRPDFAAAAEPLYWRGDLHLAPAGHALAANRIADRIESRSGR